MITARAYQGKYASQSLIEDEKRTLKEVRRTRIRQQQKQQQQQQQSNERISPPLVAAKQEKKKKPRDPSGKPEKMCSAPPATPSRPVVIPTRTAPPKSTRPMVRRTEEPAYLHNPDSIPPSMAALLAMTSIPYPKGMSMPSRDGRGGSIATAKSLEGLSVDDYRYTLSTSSPKSWEILQSPPEIIESDLWSIETDSTHANLSTSRSIESIPSLSFDSESPESEIKPLTPSTRTRRFSTRSDKTFLALHSKDCGSDHPLSPISDDGDEEALETPSPMVLTPDSYVDVLAVPTKTAKSPGRSSFKSNLTASINRLKSVALSLSSSSTAAMSLPPPNPKDPLSIPYTSERYPRFSNSDSQTSPPSPSIRAYLNPSRFSPSDRQYTAFPSLSQSRSSTSTKNSSTTNSQSFSAAAAILNQKLPQERIASSIQLQPYLRATSPSANATAPPIFVPSARAAFQSDVIGAELESGNVPHESRARAEHCSHLQNHQAQEQSCSCDAKTCGNSSDNNNNINDGTSNTNVTGPSTTRQREVRENSDFLRIVVMEMNMRRAGKMDEKWTGRARIWLPARTGEEKRKLKGRIEID